MAKENLDRAMTLHRQGRLDLAEEEYHKALLDNLDDFNALYLLGTLYLQQKRMALSGTFLRRSVDIKPDVFEALNNLGNVYKATNKEKEARECWEKALALTDRKPEEYADIYNNLATLYVNAGVPEKGVPFAEKAIELNPVHTDAHWNMGLLMLEQGFFKEGFELYKWGFKTGNRPYRNYGEKVVDWDGSHGKSIVVWGEQGIGDEILFASIIPDLQKISKEVVFDCHPRLVNIFKESFPGVACYGTRKDSSTTWVSNHPDLNAKIAIADLAQYFRANIKDFPNRRSFLKASDDRRAHYRKKLDKLGKKLKVGISWTGGYVKTRKDFRSIPLKKWEPIFKNDCDFISLQYTPEAYTTVAEIEDRLDVRIHHWPSAVQAEDYHETAALVSELDLIITVNTAVHHLAGGLGKECWTLTPFCKAWRYYSPAENQRTLPWYPSVRQWQQRTHGEWDGLLDAVGRELNKRA